MLGLLFGLFQRMRRKSRLIVEELRTAHGRDLLFASGCGILSGLSRVPGILALVRDRIVYRPLTFMKDGEIFLHNIVGFTSEDTAETRYSRARKYRRAQVLAFQTDLGEERLFVVQKDQAQAWEESLKKVGVDKR